MDGGNWAIFFSGMKVKQITCVLILHFLVVRTCSTITAGHQLSPFSILLTQPYHKLLSLAHSELFCELCQSSGPQVRELSYPFLKLFLYFAECTSGKSVSSNLVLPLLDFFHFLTVFTFLCGQCTCACGSICQDLLSGWLGQLHPDECAGSEGGQPRRVLQCRQHRARLLYRQRINYVKIQFTQDPWQILWKWSTVRNLTRHSVLQSALNPLYFTTQ